MAKTTSSDAFASALSLLVITLGAVSAALIVMCIGMYVTIISVDTSTKVQVDAKHATPDRALVSTLEGPADVKPRRLTDLRDALFHEGLDALGEGGLAIRSKTVLPRGRGLIFLVRLTLLIQSVCRDLGVAARRVFIVSLAFVAKGCKRV